ncbi:MAG: hypothetical protein EOP83_09850 [Verrucomicrobiaceae bacterium]|nr:MAG: hypothetical protein EOP83_09850 [Verrucomicrobiaceae bacterium]
MESPPPFTLYVVTGKDHWRFVWMGRVWKRHWQQSSAIEAWCEEQFGPATPGTWKNVTNTFGIQFDFYRLEMATAFKLRWYTAHT